MNRVTALVAALVLLLGACSSGADRARRDVSIGTSSSAPEAKWSPDERAALHAFTTYLKVVDQAFSEPLDPSVPALDQYATPDVAQAVRNRVLGYLELGRARRPATTFEARDVTITGDSAAIAGCITDLGAVYEVANGSVVDLEATHRQNRAELTRASGQAWRVSANDDGRDQAQC